MGWGNYFAQTLPEFYPNRAGADELGKSVANQTRH
jgi:hypothetical protein